MVTTARRRLGMLDGHAVARVAVGGVWLAGATFNALVTLRMDDPYGWLAEGSRIGAYRWFFGDVVGAHPVAWTVALVAGEAALGALTLRRGRAAVWGLAGGAAFSALLFSLSTPYTVVMGPYAIYLGWLTHERYRSSRTRQDCVIPATTAANPLPPTDGRRTGVGHLRP